ncbi:MAG: helix-turn-helix transcriptional regulator [Oscillospiraceae bacterium]|nr:helix-turn-helix transcriptional regulator [Oscillospiraceae bacterium]
MGDADLSEFNVICRIEELCKARSWTHYRLAKESGIAYSTLSTMLRKTTAPSVPTLEKICRGLGISLADFFSLEHEIALLTAEERRHLSQWNTLKESEKALVTAYIQGLLDSVH